MAEFTPEQQEQIRATAERMRVRYRTTDRACLIATDHGMDYDADDYGRRFWNAVRLEIIKQTTDGRRS